MIALLRFIQERAPHYVMLPIAVALWGGVAGQVQPDWTMWLRGLLATDLALLCLRIFDDIHSIEEDRLSKPQRGLVTGLISVKALGRTGVLLVVAIGVILWQWLLALAIAGLCLYYSVFFRFRNKLPKLGNPWFSNVFFLVMPGLANYWLTRSVTLESVLLGAFAWLAAIAHEYGHNVRQSHEPNPGGPDYTDQLGTRGLVRLTVAIFALAFIFGSLFALFQSLALGFVMPFVLCTLYLAKCCFHLWCQPSRKTAKPLYISGFAFFLLPLLGFAIQQRWAFF